MAIFLDLHQALRKNLRISFIFFLFFPTQLKTTEHILMHRIIDVYCHILM